MSDQPRPRDCAPESGELHHRNWLAMVRAHTPARAFVGQAGSAYRTATQLQLRCDHAAAVDAVQAELNLERDFVSLVEEFGLFLVRSVAVTREEYLLRPDLGRRLDKDSGRLIGERCPGKSDLQVVIGDGLSATAVAVQAPRLLPLLRQGAQERGWVFGRPFVVRYCRVGVLNDIGELLDPAVVVLLVGERPGLATAESMSAYLAYRPRRGHTNAQRNLISNIHVRGVSPVDAARRILALAEKMRVECASGVAIKEDLTASSVGLDGEKNPS